MESGHREIILNVDDDEIKRYSVTKVLERAGYEVWEAGTGREALKKAADHPDLMVLDINLPDLNGFEVCRKIKSDPKTSSLLVLHLTASYYDSSHKVYGLESGADGYLTQDIAPEELLATIRALLRMKHAEDRERAAAERLKLAVDTARLGIWEWSSGGGILCSPEAAGLVGCPAGCNPAGIYERIHPADRAELRPRIEAEIAARNPDIAVTCRIEVTPETTRWLSFHARLEYSGEEIPARAVGTVMDISELKSLEEELRARVEELADSHRHKDEFLAMLAHELRNPLSAMNSALYLFSREPQKHQELVPQVLDRQVKHLTRLVDDLVDVSRITRGRIELKKECVDLSAVVRRVVKGIAVQAREKRQTVSFSPPPGALRMVGDAVRLEQVLTNLLVNAVKYTPEGGKITVRCERENGLYRVEVEDTGVGIPPDKLSSIFEPFSQVDRSLDRTGGGLGLGLTIVRRLTEMHGGSVEAHSAGPGEGSTFTVHLPAGGPASREEDQIEGVRQAAEPRRILVVEDNLDTAVCLSEILQTFQYEVEVAYDGSSALSKAESFRPDIMLIDIGLPELNGYEVARRLRENPSFSGTLLIAITGYGQERDKESARLSGFDYHLTKPVNFDELMELIARHRETPR
jgi:signal transduction histidine kinase/DNA-binding response OmpR family regulator